MILRLLKNVGDFGIITDWKKVLHDYIDVSIGEEGDLYIGDRHQKTVDGVVRLNEHYFQQGKNNVRFISTEGVVYDCGIIERSGRFIEVTNSLDKLVVNLALSFNEQAEEIASLKSQLDDIESRRSIKII